MGFIRWPVFIYCELFSSTIFIFNEIYSFIKFSGSILQSNSIERDSFGISEIIEAFLEIYQLVTSHAGAPSVANHGSV